MGENVLHVRANKGCVRVCVCVLDAEMVTRHNTSHFLFTENLSNDLASSSEFTVISLFEAHSRADLILRTNADVCVSLIVPQVSCFASRPARNLIATEDCENHDAAVRRIFKGCNNDCEKKIYIYIHIIFIHLNIRKNNSSIHSA